MPQRRKPPDFGRRYNTAIHDIYYTKARQELSHGRMPLHQSRLYRARGSSLSLLSLLILLSGQHLT